MTAAPLFIFGTRPEIIKLAPVISEFQTQSIPIKIAFINQHPDMAEKLLSFFHITPDYTIDYPRNGSDLHIQNTHIIPAIRAIISKLNCSTVIVQGDTYSARCGAYAGYQSRIPVTHIEAGLRSHNLSYPFPEEINRRIIGQLATYHFAPTIESENNLKNEGITEHIHTVGNTIVDALELGLSYLKKSPNLQAHFTKKYPQVAHKRTILVTAHRRENWGAPLNHICNALKKLTQDFPDIAIIFPIHPNPELQKSIRHHLQNTASIQLENALDYPEFLWLLNQSHIILSDSGGLQEEASILGKPLLLLRHTTERPEAVSAGVCKLIGTEEKTIIEEVSQLLQSADTYKAMAKKSHLFGESGVSKKIIKILGHEV